MTAKRLLSFLLLFASAASLAILFATFVDAAARLRGDSFQPLAEQVAADMEERSRLHNERNERAFQLAEQTVAHFCGGDPVVVVEVYDDETALVSHDDKQSVVIIGVDRRLEDPTAYQEFWPQAGELWEIEASVRGPAIMRRIDVTEIALSAK